MIEMWFSVLTRRLLRRGEFTSREDLMQQIDTFTIWHNASAEPYRWRYDARADHVRYLTRRDQEQACAGLMKDSMMITYRNHSNPLRIFAALH